MGKTKPVLIQDSREQTPWYFSEAVDVVRKGLPVADYSVKGYETKIALERKSIDDAVRSVTWDRERFFRELTKLAEYDFARIVIEGTREDIAEHRYTGMAHPRSILGSLDSIELHFGIGVVYASDAEHAAGYAESILTKFAERREKDAKQAELTFPGESGE